MTPTCLVGHPGQRLGNGRGPSGHFLPSGHLSAVTGNLKGYLSGPSELSPIARPPRTAPGPQRQGPLGGGPRGPHGGGDKRWHGVLKVLLPCWPWLSFPGLPHRMPTARTVPPQLHCQGSAQCHLFRESLPDRPRLSPAPHRGPSQIPGFSVDVIACNYGSHREPAGGATQERKAWV